MIMTTEKIIRMQPSHLAAKQRLNHRFLLVTLLTGKKILTSQFFGSFDTPGYIMCDFNEISVSVKHFEIRDIV